MIRQARESRKLTLAELSAATGISKPYLSNIENATSVGPPSSDKLGKLAEALGLDLDMLNQTADWLRTPESIRQLLTGQSHQAPRHTSGAVNLDALLKKRSVSVHDSVAGKTENGPLVRLTSVPLINRIPAGKPVDYTDLEYPLGVADRYVGGVAGSDSQSDILPASIALRVTGDSMEPEYKDGDIVQFADAPARDGDDCLIRLGELEGFAQTFKRIYFVTQPGPDDEPQVIGVRLVPLNPKYQPREIRIEEATGIFPAIWKMSPIRKTEIKLS